MTGQLCKSSPIKPNTGIIYNMCNYNPSVMSILDNFWPLVQSQVLRRDIIMINCVVYYHNIAPKHYKILSINIGPITYKFE